MNRRPSELALVAVSLVCVLILAACNCAPTLRYITISPSGATTVPGAQVAYVATGYYSNGAITPNISVSWSSSTTTVATINGTSGVATGVASGTTTITATALGITSGTTTLTVVPATSITVTPATSTISLTSTTANTQQYDAVANYSGGSVDVTQFVTWATANANIASFSTTTAGLATAGTATGTTQVTATLNGVVGTASLTVTNGVSLVVTPATANLAVGNATGLTVQEQYPDMSLHPVTSPVTWSSDTPADANVVGSYTATGACPALPAPCGIVTGFAAGTANISATEGALTTGTATAITVDQGTTTQAYVADYSGNIDYFSANATTAPYLSGLVAKATTGYSPSQTVIDPNGQYLFLISTNSGNTFVTPYKIGSGSALTAGTPVQMVGSSDTLTYGLVDPYGRFLFVADQQTPAATGGIYAFAINQTTGALTAVTGSPFTANLNIPAGLAIDQTGTYLYASNYGFPPSAPTTAGTTIAAFSIDPNVGALTPLSTPTVTATPALSGPYYMAWDPTGTYLYVANNAAPSSGSPFVTSFTLGSNGALTQLTTTNVTGATAPLNVAVTPNGSYLYVLDGVGGLYGFTLSSGSPSTTEIAGSPFPTAGTIPNGIAIDPTSSLLAVDNADTANISVYTIGSGGVLAPQTPVSTGSGSRPFFVVFYNTF